MLIAFHLQRPTACYVHTRASHPVCNLPRGELVIDKLTSVRVVIIGIPPVQYVWKTLDAIHPKPETYAAWTNVLAQYLE
jgi:hypothetical protein